MLPASVDGFVGVRRRRSCGYALLFLPSDSPFTVIRHPESVMVRVLDIQAD